jgi:hypothetical protein
MRRLIAVVCAAVVGLGLVAPGKALALTYHQDCANDHLDRTIIVRGFGARAIDPYPQADPYLVGTDYRGVIGDAVARNLYPCDNPGPNLPDYSLPAVLPANLEGPGATEIVQLGYGECGRGGGLSCNNIANDGVSRFIYTCNDHSSGTPCDATSWAGTPLFGHRYRFRIQYNQDGTGGWNFSIKDYTTGVTKSARVTSTWHDGDIAWWGAEDQDWGATLGPCLCGGTNHIDMYWMQYLRAGGSWQVTTDSASHFTALRVGTYPTRYNQSVYNVNYTEDAIRIWTEAH